MLNDDALVAALLEVERYVAGDGWDQPSRLFALVPTAELIEAVPDLAAQWGGPTPGQLSSIEQEDFHQGRELLSALAHIEWPPTVSGCALVLERAFLPAEFEGDLPEDVDEAADAVANHPHRQELRLVTGVMRDGSRHAVARLRDAPSELLGGAEMAPGLAKALLATLD